MLNLKILLNSIEKVTRFVNIMSRYEIPADLGCGRYIIDATSMMGIFSMDLSKSLDLKIHADADDTKIDKLLAELAPFKI